MEESWGEISGGSGRSVASGDGTVLPGIIAFVAGTALAVAALVPWAAVQYRRHGSLGFRRSAGVRDAGVRARPRHYTLLPLPEDVAALCPGPVPQLVPLTFVQDIVKEGGVSGPRSLLSNPAAAQVLFNVILFTPLGALVRHAVMRHRWFAGLLVGTAVGFGVSLLIECTQLTGDWFLYPCSYRLFDVDDLLANTSGALLGTLAAPLVALLAGSDRQTDASAPRPVTLPRRGFGMFADLLAIVFTGGLLTSGLALTLALLDVDQRSDTAVALLVVAALVAPAGQLVIVLVTGRTLGEHVVRLRPVRGPAAVHGSSGGPSARAAGPRSTPFRSRSPDCSPSCSSSPHSSVSSSRGTGAASRTPSSGSASRTTAPRRVEPGHPTQENLVD